MSRGETGVGAKKTSKTAAEKRKTHRKIKKNVKKLRYKKYIKENIGVSNCLFANM